MPKFIFIIILLSIGILIEACAGGASENLPPFNPDQTGWQSVTIEKGDVSVTQSNSRDFQIFYKDAASADPLTLQEVLSDFFPPAFALFAAEGVGFSLKTDSTANGLTVTLLSGQAESALLRTSIVKQESFGNHQLVTFNLESRIGTMPVLDPSYANAGHDRYTFRAYLNLAVASFPASTAQLEVVITRALAQMLGELRPGKPAAGGKGRVYLIDYRFVYSDNERLGLFLKLVVDL
jgi:hypothetical protein